MEVGVEVEVEVEVGVGVGVESRSRSRGRCGCGGRSGTRSRGLHLSWLGAGCGGDVLRTRHNQREKGDKCKQENGCSEVGIHVGLLPRSGS